MSLLPSFSRFPAVKGEPSGTVGMSGGIYRVAPLAVCSPREPVSQGIPLVDDGTVLTLPPLGLVVIGSVLALKVTDLSEFQIQVFFVVLCFSLLGSCPRY